MSFSDSAYRFLDVGGTFIKRADGTQVPTMSDKGREDIAAAIRKAIGPAEGLKGVGVAIPGPFDYAEGTFLMKHKFASVFGENFRTLAKLPESVEVKYLHDVNALLLGAVNMLGLKNGNTALVTLGTGLGFSYTLDGSIQYGPGGSPLLSLWNTPAPWGGILEDRISARGICGEYRAMTGENRPAHAIARMAYASDPTAMRVYAGTGALLGEALREILRQLGTEVLLVGGQIAGSLSLMLAPLQEALPGISIMRAPEGAVFQGLAYLFENQ